MNEKQTPSPDATVRPTKKQKELLEYIERFIGEHGYSPSYREIMKALDYTSVATVALHVNNLITRGHLRKRERNARSLEVTQPSGAGPTISSNQVRPTEEKWLTDQVEHRLSQAELAAEQTPAALSEIEVLLAALKVLGMEGAAQSFTARLKTLRARPIGSQA